MARIRKEPNRYWSKEDKLKLVKEVINEHKSMCEVCNRENISSGMFHNWIKRYLKDGEQGLENRIKPGNPLAKYQQRKELTEIEKI